MWHRPFVTARTNTNMHTDTYTHTLSHIIRHDTSRTYHVHTLDRSKRNGGCTNQRNGGVFGETTHINNLLGGQHVGYVYGCWFITFGTTTRVVVVCCCCCSCSSCCLLLLLLWSPAVLLENVRFLVRFGVWQIPSHTDTPVSSDKLAI